MGRIFLIYKKRVTHKLFHGLTAAGASLLSGQGKLAVVSGLAAMGTEAVVDTLDAIDHNAYQNMTPQERKVLQQREFQKELDRKTNKSLFNFTIRNRDIASLITAFTLALTTPEHMIPQAFAASQRALDWNHDVSEIKAKMLEEIEEKEKLDQIKETLKGHVIEGVEVNFDGTLTPRRLSGLKAYRDAQIMNDQKRDLMIHPPMMGVDNAAFMGSMEDPIDAFNQAYLKTQSQLEHCCINSHFARFVVKYGDRI